MLTFPDWFRNKPYYLLPNSFQHIKKQMELEPFLLLATETD